ncbi:MAG TPA: hypothetical protein GXZ56_10560 [Bacteroidales bacterium]|nr:Ig-like domain-containing protein [Bacteroidota bacterium]HHU27041.1 hypothetical protein [Bacteroidales bacterium]
MKRGIHPIYIILSSLLLIPFAGCEEEKPTDPITLSAKSVVVKVGETATVTLGGGTGTYEAASSKTAVATVTLQGKVLTITGVSKGTANIAITSGDKTAQLAVTVEEKKEEIPSLSATGVYDGTSQRLAPKLIARSDKGQWLCQKMGTPYEQRLFIAHLPASAKVGDEVQLKVIDYGVLSEVEDNKEVRATFIIEKVSPLQLKLKSSNARVYIQ